jgi:hypothetical protein
VFFVSHLTNKLKIATDLMMPGKYNAINHNDRYSYSQFDDNGFYVKKLSNSNVNLDSLLEIINVSCMFQDRDISTRVFNENKIISKSKGRNMIVFDALKLKQDQNELYPSVVSMISQLSDKIMTECNNDLNYKMDLLNSLPTILETVSNKTKAQLIHIDLAYDYVYTEQLLCLVALQENTMIRIIHKSHLFKTFEEMNEARLKGHLSHMIPQVITLKKGEYIIMHPKLWHSGWIAHEHNVRVHFYFNLKQIKENPVESVQKSTYFIGKALECLFNGLNYERSNKTIKKRGREEKSKAKLNKLIRLGAWNKHVEYVK